MWETALAGLETNLLNFASFFGVAVLLLALFVIIYIYVTPYNEFELIRAGNVAAAITLGGALLGFALPLAVSVAVNHDLLAMLVWGGVAGGVQLATFVVARMLLPGLNQLIPQGQIAAGLFLAMLALGVGVLNAGCMV